MISGKHDIKGFEEEVYNPKKDSTVDAKTSTHGLEREKQERPVGGRQDGLVERVSL